MGETDQNDEAFNASSGTHVLNLTAKTNVLHDADADANASTGGLGGAPGGGVEAPASGGGNGSSDDVVHSDDVGNEPPVGVGSI